MFEFFGLVAVGIIFLDFIFLCEDIDKLNKRCDEFQKELEDLKNEQES